jgi:hypothetical protein
VDADVVGDVLDDGGVRGVEVTDGRTKWIRVLNEFDYSHVLKRKNQNKFKWI